DMSQKLIYITAASADEAATIARTLVAERLAACANVFPPVRSFYWWEGKVQDDAEVVLIAKTRAALVPRLIERVKALHSYDCPCVVALPIEAGNPEFLAWIDGETADG
ncbi:MAG: divalent-cation tolerance protein CutA, partial [Alphaproteobacteria bacterium]